MVTRRWSETQRQMMTQFEALLLQIPDTHGHLVVAVADISPGENQDTISTRVALHVPPTMPVQSMMAVADSMLSKAEFVSRQCACVECRVLLGCIFSARAQIPRIEVQNG